MTWDCEFIGICSDIKKLEKSKKKSINKDLADQYAELCTNSPSLESGTLTCSITKPCVLPHLERCGLFWVLRLQNQRF